MLVLFLPNGYTEATKRLLGKTCVKARHAVPQGATGMPKFASSRVAWSATRQKYLIEETTAHTLLEMEPESPAWFEWLDRIPSFAFWGKTTHYTVRKEQRPRGEGYWYAYRGVGKK